ncbi:hypothetical protein, partial [Deinococcus sp.]|uniref:hypothetical protein n=1 Tax=Deinococcus sp. TaxID=47478 RepID=UPI0025C30EAC
MRVWTRKGGCQDRQESEANKWFEVVDRVEAAPQSLAQRITFINDREGDIFALWKRIGSAHDMLTRAKQDRRIAVTESCPTGKLFADLAAQPIQGTFELVIPADPKNKRQ